MHSKPDRLRAVALHGTAWNLASGRGRIDRALDELRALAGGRNDLLAEEAGRTVGAWLADPETRTGVELIVAGLLVQAGSPPDFELIGRTARETYERATSPLGKMHGA